MMARTRLSSGYFLGAGMTPPIRGLGSLRQSAAVQAPPTPDTSWTVTAPCSLHAAPVHWEQPTGIGDPKSPAAQECPYGT